MQTSPEEWQDARFDVSDDYGDERVSGLVRKGFGVCERCGAAQLVHVATGVLFGMFDTVELAMFAGDLATIGLEGGDFAAMGEEQRRQAFDRVVDCWMVVGMAAIGCYDGPEAIWYRLRGPGGVNTPLGFGPTGPNCTDQSTLQAIDCLIDDLNAARAQLLEASQQRAHV